MPNASKCTWVKCIYLHWPLKSPNVGQCGRPMGRVGLGLGFPMALVWVYSRGRHIKRAYRDGTSVQHICWQRSWRTHAPPPHPNHVDGPSTWVGSLEGRIPWILVYNQWVSGCIRYLAPTSLSYSPNEDFLVNQTRTFATFHLRLRGRSHACRMSRLMGRDTTQGTGD